MKVILWNYIQLYEPLGRACVCMYVCMCARARVFLFVCVHAFVDELKHMLKKACEFIYIIQLVVGKCNFLLAMKYWVKFKQQNISKKILRSDKEIWRNFKAKICRKREEYEDHKRYGDIFSFIFEYLKTTSGDYSMYRLYKCKPAFYDWLLEGKVLSTSWFIIDGQI